MRQFQAFTILAALLALTCYLTQVSILLAGAVKVCKIQ